MNEQPTTTTTIHCPRCGQALAQSDGRSCLVGVARIDHKVTLHCVAPGCRGRCTWHPRVVSPDRTGVLVPA